MVRESYSTVVVKDKFVIWDNRENRRILLARITPKKQIIRDEEGVYGRINENGSQSTVGGNNDLSAQTGNLYFSPGHTVSGEGKNLSAQIRSVRSQSVPATK